MKKAEESIPDVKNQRNLLLANYGMVLLAGLNTGWIGPLIPTIARQHHMPVTELGSLLSVQFFGCLVTMSMGKKIVDLLGIKASLIAASIVTLLGFLLFGLGGGQEFLWLGSLLIGAGTGINSVTGTLVVLRLVKENSATALNKVHLFFGLGALLGPGIAWLSHISPFSYRAAFIFGALVSLGLTLIATRASELAKAIPEKEPPPSKETLKKPLLWIYSLVLFFYVGIESGATAWLFVFLRKASLLPHEQASLGMSALWLGLTLSRFYSGRLCRMYSPAMVATSGMILSLITLAILSLNPQLSMFTLVVVAILGCGYGPVFPTVLAMVNSRFYHSMALVTTVAVTTGFLGGMIYPYAVGKIFEGEGLKTGMGFLAGGSLLMILLFLVTLRKGMDNDDQAHQPADNSSRTAKDFPEEELNISPVTSPGEQS